MTEALQAAGPGQLLDGFVVLTDEGKNVGVITNSELTAEPDPMRLNTVVIPTKTSPVTVQIPSKAFRISLDRRVAHVRLAILRKILDDVDLLVLGNLETEGLPMTKQRHSARTEHLLAAAHASLPPPLTDEEIEQQDRKADEAWEQTLADIRATLPPAPRRGR